MALTDDQLSALQQSAGFQPGSNYLTYPTILGGRLIARDEFVTTIPFEAYTRDPLRGVTEARPDNSPTSAAPAFFPKDLATTSGADWFSASGSPTSMDLAIETSLISGYEQFNFRRIGTSFDIDAFQAKVVASRGGATVGPDVKATLIRLASMAVARQLSRDAINSTEYTTSPTKIAGLAGLYDGLFPTGTGTSLTDTWQVLKASSGSPFGLIADVRKLLRRVSPSGGAFGQGPNMLLMSQRARDALIAVERGMSGMNQPVFLPGPDGELRYHFDGVPVYVGPVREDEDPTGSVPGYSTVATDATSIYALRVGGPSGVRLLHVGGESQQFGIVVEPVAQAPGSVTEGYRVHGTYTLLVPERQSVARLFGVMIASEPW